MAEIRHAASSATPTGGVIPHARLNNIQGLRAVAAFMVVLYHARLLTPLGERIAFDFGNAGVDIFFIISGFIINHVAGDDDVGAPGRFLLKRAIRIVPLYWLLTLMVGALAALVPALAGAGGVPDVGRIVRSLLFVPYYDDTGQTHPVLFMGWTLNYEMFFYLLFAVGLLLFRREATRLIAVSGVLAMLVLAGWTVDPRGAIATTYTDPVLLEFVIGMWMSRAWHQWPAWRGVGRWLPMMAIVTGVGLLVGGDLAWPNTARLVRWGAPATIIVAAALMLERSGATIGHRWLLLLGDASYAIYLLHPFIIKAITLAMPIAATTSVALSPVMLAGVMIAVALLGIAAHVLIERPLVHALRRRVIPKPRLDVSAIIAEPTRLTMI